jgi:hypothetical protein
MICIGPLLFRIEKIQARIEQKRFRQRKTISVSAPNSFEYGARPVEAGVLRSQSLARERSPPAINNHTPYLRHQRGQSFHAPQTIDRKGWMLPNGGQSCRCCQFLNTELGQLETMILPR